MLWHPSKKRKIINERMNDSRKVRKRGETNN
jgi:hypothetical protein